MSEFIDAVVDTATAATVLIIGLLVAANLLLLVAGLIRNKWHKRLPTPGQRPEIGD